MHTDIFGSNTTTPPLDTLTMRTRPSSGKTPGPPYTIFHPMVHAGTTPHCAGERLARRALLTSRMLLLATSRSSSSAVLCWR